MTKKMNKISAALALTLAVMLCIGTMFTANAATSSYIGISKAKSIALAEAGLKESEVSFTKAKLDRDDGVVEYDIEFYNGNDKYEVEVEATSGEINSYSVKYSITISASNSTKYVGISTAKKTALSHAGLSSKEVTFVKAKLDKSEYYAEYDIEFTTDTMHYEYEIYAANGIVKEFTRERIVQTGTKTSSSSTGRNITLEEAKSIALKHAGYTASQVTFTKAKLDYDDGAYYYDIEFRVGSKEYEYEINAKTGAIVEYDVDWD